MDRRKKRTSTNQYSMYIDLMEKDHIFATGRVPRDVDVNYLQKKWKELAESLNTCSSGPRLTAEEWKKRLNDWKNTTRCKYRRSLSGEKDIQMTALEMKALELFGKAPNLSSGSEQISINLKSEKEDIDDDCEEPHSLQKELQAVVEEAIGSSNAGGAHGHDGEEEEEDEMHQEEHDEEILPDTSNGQVAGTAVLTNASSTTYRTIVVENANYTDDEHNDEQLEFINHRRSTNIVSNSGPTISAISAGGQTINAPAGTTVTKLINGEIPLKRLRTHAPEQIVYEFKKAAVSQPVPRSNITIHNTNASTQPQQHHHHHQQQQQQYHNTLESSSSNMITTTLASVSSQDAREIGRQLKRLADVKTEKLKFEIARFKFNNPGFHYNYSHL